MAASTVTRSPAELPKLFASAPADDLSAQAAVWSACYRDDFHPWDRAGPSLALADLLSQRSDLVPASQEHDSRGNLVRGRSGSVVRRTALVPGCGLGHDALLLAAFGYDVWAVDVSEDAIELAKSKAGEAAAALRVPDHFERGSVTWLTADFFAEEWAAGAGTDGTGKFDLIFDYTFLCALPVDLRPRWAARIADLIHPKGRLVCLEFPSGKPLSDLGPPWGVNPEVYEALLAAPGDPVSYHPSGDGSIIDIPSPKPRDNAIHRISLVKPRRTHPAGTDEDGYIRDFISVWSR